MLRRRLLAAAVTVVMSAGIGVAAADGLPVATPLDAVHERDATAFVDAPDTPSCTETLMTHDFQNSYGAPFNGSYSPPADCPGPWAKVVLTLTSTVGGVQFDRDVYVAIGHAVVLDGTTSEPCCSPTRNTTTWTVQRDVTDITPLLANNQPVQVELDNVNDAQYTGVYHTVISLRFYKTSDTTPAGMHPDAVWPISSSSSGGPMLGISKDGATVGDDVTFPNDLSRLSAEVFADAHGPCEEFWWADPFDCVGTPYREIGIYVDGRLAGAAPAYPVIYTGASGPGLWEPIPSPRAWNIRPYDLDLTPFVGLLTDGQPHSIRLGVFGTQLQSGDFWQLAANLQGWIDDPGVPTVGSLVSATGDPQPTQDQTDPTGQGVPYTDTASHNLTFVGTETIDGQQVKTTVTESMGEDDKQAGGDDARWSWDYSTSRDVNGHNTTTTAQQIWGLVSDILTSYHLSESGTTSTTVDGSRSAWTSYTESMDTQDTTGIAFNGAEQESYGYSDSAGACVDRELVGVAGEAVENFGNTGCPGAPSQAAR